jgi:hypothetical protein
MHPEIRRNALQQTARIALGGVVLSCSQSQPRESQVQPLPQATAPATQSVPRTTSSAACNITAGADGGLAQSSFKCCIEATRAAAKGDRAADADWSTQRPDLADCCRALGRGEMLMSILYSEDRAWTHEACWACEKVVGNQSCTPWGPPMPPSMA